jgi:hypothetical protein
MENTCDFKNTEIVYLIFLAPINKPFYEKLVLNKRSRGRFTYNHKWISSKTGRISVNFKCLVCVIVSVRVKHSASRNVITSVIYISMVLRLFT